MSEPKKLERRLLGHVMHDPHRSLTLAIASGMAVSVELARRGELAALLTLSTDGTLCTRAAEAVMTAWATAGRLGSIEPKPFERLCDDILEIARAQ